MVDDAAVSQEGRRVRFGDLSRGFSGLLLLLLMVLLGVRAVRLPGSAAVESAVVHQDQAGAQGHHEQHGHPMALQAPREGNVECHVNDPPAERTVTRRGYEV